MKISLGYPSAEDEGKMLNRFKAGDPMAALTPMAESGDIIEIQRLVEKIHVDPSINKYIVQLTRLTREQGEVSLGASPRAALCLYKAAQAWALYSARDYVIPDDVIKMAPHVLEHRILMKQEAKLKKITALTIVARVLEQVNPESL
jgi:MoxR-like ATPase